MKLKEKNTKVELVYSKAFINDLGKFAIEHYPNEIGGFLVGKYAKDFRTLYLTDFLVPEKFINSAVMFERSTVGLDDKLVQLFKQKKEYYIGEWHSHPDGSTLFSRTDLNAMRTIARCPSVKIVNPILLILSGSRYNTGAYNFYLFRNDKLLKYE